MEPLDKKRERHDIIKHQVTGARVGANDTRRGTFKAWGETEVAFYSIVLRGEWMFNLLLYAFVNTDRVSQRRLEVMFNSQQFKTLFNYAEGLNVSKSSKSARLSKMNVGFFEKAYELIYGRLSKSYTERARLVRCT